MIITPTSELNTETALPVNTTTFPNIISCFRFKETSGTSVTDVVSNAIWTPSAPTLSFSTVTNAVTAGTVNSGAATTSFASGSVPNITSGHFLFFIVCTLVNHTPVASITTIGYGDGDATSTAPFLGFFLSGATTLAAYAGDGTNNATANFTIAKAETTPVAVVISGTVGASKTIDVYVSGQASTTLVTSAGATIGAMSWESEKIIARNTSMLLMGIMTPTNRPSTGFVKSFATWLAYNVGTSGNKTIYPGLKGR